MKFYSMICDVLRGFFLRAYRSAKAQEVMRSKKEEDELIKKETLAAVRSFLSRIFFLGAELILD